jgi:clathrin heavy chain
MAEDVAYWKWINETTLGLVTPTSVYHWSIQGDSPPKKIFDRHSSLLTGQVISYRVNPSETWMVLIAISAMVCLAFKYTNL